jgi:hypothetical protein
VGKSRVREQILITLKTIDLVLIDQQSVGKRNLHLIDTVNAKQRWTTIYWRVNKFSDAPSQRANIILEN